jgi:triacylglycerol esterase/lipase EstA (alpha/beta hydrolase family)
VCASGCYLDDVDTLALSLLAVVTVPLALIGGGVWSFLLFHHVRWLRWHRRNDRAELIDDVALVGYLAAEGLAYLRVMWFRLLWPLRRPDGGDGGRPVLCVHGFGGAGADFTGMLRALRAAGRPAYTLSMGPALGAVEEWAAQVAARLQELKREHPGAGVDLIAHSMGGLVCRWVLAHHPELASEVQTLVTLGTPHAGTAVVGRVPMGRGARQMRRGSSFLDDLPAPATSAPRCHVVTIGARRDYIVYPRETCRLDGVEHAEMSVGHTGLIVAPQVVTRVVEALERGRKENGER